MSKLKTLWNWYWQSEEARWWSFGVICGAALINGGDGHYGWMLIDLGIIAIVLPFRLAAHARRKRKTTS